MIGWASDQNTVINNNGNIAVGNKAETSSVGIYGMGSVINNTGNIKTGKKPKEEIHETNKIAKYKYINAGTVETGYVSSFNNEKDTVTTPSRGQGGIGFIGFQSEKFWLGALCYGIKSKEEKNHFL